MLHNYLSRYCCLSCSAIQQSNAMIVLFVFYGKARHLDSKEGALHSPCVKGDIMDSQGVFSLCPLHTPC